MRKLLAAFLSMLAFCSCNKLPPRPDGWHCTYFYSQAPGFYCNRINKPEEKNFFKLDDQFINKAQCMDLETFDRYTKYVEEIKDIVERNCRQE